MTFVVFAAGRAGHFPVSPVVALAILLLIVFFLSRTETAKKLAPGGRHKWTPEEHRAVIKFYIENRELDAHRFEEALLKLAKDLSVSPNSARMAVKAVEGLARPGTNKLKPSRGLREAWQSMRLEE